MVFAAPNPYVRGVALILGIAGTLLSENVFQMLIVWVGVIIPMTLFTHIFKPYMQFLVSVLLPVGIALLLVWVLLLGAPPGKPTGSDIYGGAIFAITIILRLAILGGITQIAFLTLSHQQLILTLRSWGLKGEGLIIVLGCFALLPEMKLRANQILTARLARGLATNNSVYNRLMQVPFLLRPLIAWTLKSAINRSEMWRQRNVYHQAMLVPIVRESSSMVAGLLYTSATAVWFIYNIVAYLSK